MKILRAGVFYFMLVFAAGFVLGPIRLAWLVPSVGERTAELMEMPLMLAVVIVAARWTLQRYAVAGLPSHRLAIGCVALGLLVRAEAVIVHFIRGLSIRRYLANRDPVAAAVYYLMLGVFAIMPILVGSSRPKTAGPATDD